MVCGMSWEWKIPKLNVEFDTLENNLGVIIHRKKLLTVAYRILSKFGYRNEEIPEEIHLLEHMMFKPEERIFPVFQKMGGDINGYVAMDEFGIYWNIPHVFQMDAANTVMNIIDKNRHYWTKEMLKREKNVILREISENFSNPRSYIGILVRRKLFGEGAPGTHDPREIERAFNGISIDYIRSKADKMAPEASVLAIVGVAEDGAAEIFGDWSGTPCRVKALKPDPEYGWHFEARETMENFLSVAWIGAPKSTVDSEVLSLLAAILAAFPTSRLYRRLRIVEGLVYYVVALNFSFVDTGYFMINTSTVPRHTREVIGYIMDEVVRIIDDGISEEEVRDMKNMFFGMLYNLTDSKVALSSTLAYNGLFYGDPLKLYNETAVMVSKLRPEDIQRVAREYLKPEKNVVCVIGRKY